MVNFSFSTEISAPFLDLDMLVVWSRRQVKKQLKDFEPQQVVWKPSARSPKMDTFWDDRGISTEGNMIPSVYVQYIYIYISIFIYIYIFPYIYIYIYLIIPDGRFLWGWANPFIFQ